jgi:FkbM family methyltransferase
MKRRQFEPLSKNTTIWKSDMKFIRQILRDFYGIVRVCGLLTGIKWLLFILFNLIECIKRKNLQPADKKLGTGPFKVKYDKAKATMYGEQVISGIREIWVRDVYLGNGFLSLEKCELVLDLGANMGNFTILALASNSRSKVIAVEPNSELNLKFYDQIKKNRWNDRVKLFRSFIGLYSTKQKEMLNDPLSKDAVFISQEEFIKKNNLRSIDFLKCDIEGSEFDFIKDTSLLQITKQLAIEIHDFGGSRDEFIAKLVELGFQIGPIKHSSDSCIVLAKRI